MTDLSSAHHGLLSKCQLVQSGYVKQIVFSCLPYNKHLSRSVWENVDLGQDSVKIIFVSKREECVFGGRDYYLKYTPGGVGTRLYGLSLHVPSQSVWFYSHLGRK